MILKGKKVYLKKGISDREYYALLKWFHDIEIMNQVSFSKKALQFDTVEQIKSFFKASKNHLLFGIYTHNNELIGYAEIFNTIELFIGFS